jgi:hypothetical protein
MLLRQRPEVQKVPRKVMNGSLSACLRLHMVRLTFRDLPRLYSFEPPI